MSETGGREFGTRRTREHRFDVYPERHSIDRKVAGLRRDLPAGNARAIVRFLERCAADGLTPARQSFYATYLKGLARILGKSFLKPTRADVERVLAEIESRDYEAWTKIGYRTSLKRFYKWHLGNDEDYPDVVRWVKIKKNGLRTKLPKDLLTHEEIAALIRACLNERDRAFIALLADSGCRIGEVLTLRIGDVTFDAYGMVLTVSGKTGDRRVRVIGDSIAYVAAWLEVHPAQRDRTAPLLVGLDARTRERGVTYAQARKVIKSATRRAGINKRIYPHLFRHTKATELASKVPEAPLEAHMGWVPGSSMSRTYVHLSGRDVDRAILRASGINVEPETKEEARVRVCPRCQVQNASTFKFCRRCGLPLDVEIAVQLEDDRQRDEGLNPSLEAMRSEVLRLQRELDRLARGLSSPGRSSAPGA